jgi:hypothetical protein
MVIETAMECPDFRILRLEEVRASAEKYQAAIVKHADARGKEQRFADIVRNEQRGFVEWPEQA